MLLAIVTIMSHRAHTEGVLLKTDANDKWSYYQASRIKFHNLELGRGHFERDAHQDSGGGENLVRYEKDKEKDNQEGRKISRRRPRAWKKKPTSSKSAP